MRALLLIILFGLINILCYSQTSVSINDNRNDYDEKGDYYFDKKEYKKSIVYYNMAYKMDAKNYYSILRKAEAFTALGLYDQAIECYRIIFETSLYIPNEFRLHYVFLLLKNKDISGFEKWMSKYNEIVRNEIKGYISSTEVRAKMYKDSSIVIVENESVLNTIESEICPAVYQDKVIFSSTRKNLTASTGNNYYNVFSASYLKSGHLGRLNGYNTNLNSTLNESSIAFSDKPKTLYFTRSKSTNSNFKTYATNIPENINDALNTREVSVEGISSIGQPAFNSDGTIMYFVSEAPGGFGGLDIYFSKLSGSKWSKPVNLGASVNSEKDEMYPYILNDTILYFSSAGHNGLGGLDLFSYSLTRESGTAKNLGNKVNSKYDDYSLSFSPEGYTGYFCSNRPGGFGKEDIYRVHLLDIKVKYAAFRFKRKSFMEDDKINLYVSNGDEYNIASEDKSGFNFAFLPDEGYKMVIQHENPLASNIIYNDKFTADQKKKAFLSPTPFQKTDIKLQTGMRYQFTAGMKAIGQDYKNALKEMSKGYQNSSANTIDLTALAKELQLSEGEIYTIQFVKDKSQYSSTKTKGESSLFINDKTINVTGNSFFIVLPLDIEANFNIKTDIAHFKETFSPKKVGAVKVDAEPVYKEEPIKQVSKGFPILVNTASFNEAGKKISATELTIIPGSLYVLTLVNTSPGKGKDPGIVIPLTKGVKYNLGTNSQSKDLYNKAIQQMTSGQAAKSGEELIDISILSKELDVMTDENIVFNLIPATKLASQGANTRNVLSILDVDGRKYYITNMQKLQVTLKLEQDKKVNIQTDLNYVKENFVPSTIALKVDTTSFNSNIKEKTKNIITDPVFDKIVVNFNLNDYSIRSDAKSILADKVIQALKGDSRLYVTIKGYTDPIGDAAYNEKLSKNRAQTVKDFLINNGIGEKRIRTFSYGESLALKDGVKWEDLSEKELQKHRKVEIVIYLPK